MPNLNNLAQNPPGKLASLLTWFLGWFWPRFNASAFVLSRAQEYEADAAAARATSAPALASALQRLVVDGPLLDERLWAKVFLLANDAAELARAVDLAARYDEWIVIEEAVRGREIEVSVLGNLQPRASVPGEITPSREFYDYEDKYVVDGATLSVPAAITPDQADSVRDLAVKVFSALRCEGMARVDFFLVEDGSGWRFYCNEVNTIPGFTPISMYPKLWQASGVSYPELIDELVTLALERHRRKRRHVER